MKKEVKKILKQICGNARIEEYELLNLEQLYSDNVEYFYEDDKEFYGNIVSKAKRLFMLTQENSEPNKQELRNILIEFGKYVREDW